MPRKGAKFDRKVAGERFTELIKKFGDSVAEVFDDPDVRKKAREFSETIIDSTAKVVNSRIKDDEVRTKFHDVGKAAQALGKSLATHLTSTEQT
jgi:ribosomal-protein-alanine N-acetyltransferase